MGKSKKTNRQVKERPIVEAINNDAENSVGKNKLARALGSVDYHTREKGMQVLTLWLTRRSQISEQDILKVWRGVFFCFWHSDKVPVQTELAERLAGILPQLREETALLYFTGFVQIMRREWLHIDRLRLDKFLLLVRCFMQQLFVVFKQSGWDAAKVKPYMSMMQTEVLLPPHLEKARGLAFHIADVFLPEFLKVAAEQAPGHPCWQELLIPFGHMLEQVDAEMYLQRVRDAVFDPLVSELRDPSEGTPCQHFDAASFAGQLFDMGSQSSIPARNRQALYGVSQTLERVVNKKAKKDVSHKDAEHTGTKAEANGTEQQQKKKGKAEKKKDKSQGSLEQGATEVGVNGTEEQRKKGKGEKTGKKKDKSQGSLEQGATEVGVNGTPQQKTTGKAGKTGKNKVDSPAGTDTLTPNSKESVVGNGDVGHRENKAGSSGRISDEPGTPGSTPSGKKKKKKSNNAASSSPDGAGSAAAVGSTAGKAGGTAAAAELDTAIDVGVSGVGSAEKGKSSSKKRKSERGSPVEIQARTTGEGASISAGREGETGAGADKVDGKTEEPTTFESDTSVTDWLRVLGIEHAKIPAAKKGARGDAALGVSKKMMKKKKKSALEQVGGDAALTLLGQQLVRESEGKENAAGAKNRQNATWGTSRGQGSHGNEEVSGTKGNKDGSKDAGSSKVVSSPGRVLQEAANGTAPSTPTTPKRGEKGAVKMSSPTSKENGTAPSKQAGNEERQTKAHVKKKKKGVVINLKQNIYFPFGSSPPPPELRTPPAARSKGSILKKPAS